LDLQELGYSQGDLRSNQDNFEHIEGRVSNGSAFFVSTAPSSSLP
jgi:hypothetical protein